MKLFMLVCLLVNAFSLPFALYIGDRTWAVLAVIGIASSALGFAI